MEGLEHGGGVYRPLEGWRRADERTLQGLQRTAELHRPLQLYAASPLIRGRRLTNALPVRPHSSFPPTLLFVSLTLTDGGFRKQNDNRSKLCRGFSNAGVYPSRQSSGVRRFLPSPFTF